MEFLCTGEADECVWGVKGVETIECEFDKYNVAEWVYYIFI